MSILACLFPCCCTPSTSTINIKPKSRPTSTTNISSPSLVSLTINVTPTSPSLTARTFVPIQSINVTESLSPPSIAHVAESILTNRSETLPSAPEIQISTLPTPSTSTTPTSTIYNSKATRCSRFLAVPDSPHKTLTSPSSKFEKAPTERDESDTTIPVSCENLLGVHLKIAGNLEQLYLESREEAPSISRSPPQTSNPISKYTFFSNEKLPHNLSPNRSKIKMMEKMETIPDSFEEEGQENSAQRHSVTGRRGSIKLSLREMRRQAALAAHDSSFPIPEKTTSSSSSSKRPSRREAFKNMMREQGHFPPRNRLLKEPEKRDVHDGSGALSTHREKYQNTSAI